jgi:ribosomal protein S18 acetylase RimI-like enzyme
MLSFRDQVRTRRAGAGDAEALATVFRESWLNAYQGVIPKLHLDRMILRRGADWWRHAASREEAPLVLEVAGLVGGYVTFGPSRARGPYKGEIYELYLAPTHQGLGLGEMLFEGARAQLDSKGLRGLVVWALVDNQSACHFYWRRGGRPAASVWETFGIKRLEKAAFVWA